MSAVIRQRGLSSTVKLNYGALYSVIETLHHLGLIVPVETRREGRHPERTIYTTTEAGRAELFDWLRVLIRTPATEYTQLAAGLALIAHFSPDEAVALLVDRMHSLSEQIDEQHAALETYKQQGVDRLFLINVFGVSSDRYSAGAIMLSASLSPWSGSSGNLLTTWDIFHYDLSVLLYAEGWYLLSVPRIISAFSVSSPQAGSPGFLE